MKLKITLFVILAILIIAVVCYFAPIGLRPFAAISMLVLLFIIVYNYINKNNYEK